jgi:carbonic anhydrase
VRRDEGAADARRSLAISQQLLGTREVVVSHHTDCGLQTFTNAELRARRRTALGQSRQNPHHGGWARAAQRASRSAR